MQVCFSHCRLVLHRKHRHHHYQAICWEAGVWLPAVNNVCHSFLSSAVLLSATYFPYIRSLSRCILFLPRVAFPLILPSSIQSQIFFTLWPHEPDLDRVKVNQHAKYHCHFKSYCLERHTNNRPSALSVPLKWPVNVLICKLYLLTVLVSAKDRVIPEKWPAER